MPFSSFLKALSDEKLKRYATYASTSVALALIIGKSLAFWLTDSVALLSSTVDSAMDLLASTAAFLGVLQAQKPPDREHRFGHGKAEPLTSLLIATFIAGSAFLLVMETLDRFGTPRALQNTRAGYLITGVALILTFFLVLFQTYVIRRTDAIAIKADRLHYSSDFAINIAVLITFALQDYTGVEWIDPAFALAIASMLLKSAYDVAKQAYHIMMDRELPEEDRQQIKAIVHTVPGVIGLHDLRTRSDSVRPFIEFHLEMNGEQSLTKAHDITHNVIDALIARWPEADISIHQEPAGLDDERLDTRLPHR